ncbi:hypothetical protein GCM10014715_54690 [Streptomyces spiralis]|uniref:Uncharacterized protein n=1 Tax=Streptomyces spiralis TaxID=66376 RepID=A0A919DXS6_9ACTN|nr:hypothetical protein GCM10014715_54690 [Streptomyces spiralis]
MPPTAELIGAAATLLGLGFLTLCSVRSITRRPPTEAEQVPRPGPAVPRSVRDAAGGCRARTAHV